MTASTPVARIGAIGSPGVGYALFYDFGGTTDGFVSTGSFGAAPPAGGTAIRFLTGGACPFAMRTQVAF